MPPGADRAAAGGRVGRPGGAVVGVGVDAVDLDRFRAVVSRTPSVLDRLFTEAERAYAATAIDPTARLAARFAAKEAVMKVLGVGLGAFGFRDVEVVRAGSGSPSLVLRGGAAVLADTQGAMAWHLSLSHTQRTAMAVALATS